MGSPARPEGSRTGPQVLPVHLNCLLEADALELYKAHPAVVAYSSSGSGGRRQLKLPATSAVDTGNTCSLVNIAP